MTALANRLTDALDIRHPIVSAPMAFVGGGALAAAVSRAGGLGLIGGGYGDGEWINEQFEAARGERVGIGFITWSAALTPSVVAASTLILVSVWMWVFGCSPPSPIVAVRSLSGSRTRGRWRLR